MTGDGNGGAPLRVMVVEDDPDICNLVRVLLRKEARLKVACDASSAEEALRLLPQVRPSLIVLDMALEGQLTGLEAAPALKAAAPDAKILLFTAFDVQSLADAEPSVDAYLRKDDAGLLLTTATDLLKLA